MANTKFLLFSTLILFGRILFAQVAPNYYIVEFTDKSHSEFTIDQPELFLSQRAIERRNIQNISIDELDLPVSNFYIDSLISFQIEIHNISKWFNSVVIHVDNSEILATLESLSFVKKIYYNTRKSNYHKQVKYLEKTLGSIQEIPQSNEYGYGFGQIKLFNGHKLHQEGFMGQGMQIAVLDAGFADADSINSLNNLWEENRVLGNHDFVTNSNLTYNKHYHGTAVLSVMAGYLPGIFIGTAPKASYWLLRTEDGDSEYRIEEENWISAAEFADSAGVDVINTSLGYSVFNDPLQNYSYADMNGKTARISVAAEIAATRGMLIVTSAGNEGNDVWKYITAPADADKILTVGSVDSLGNYSPFSSQGPTADGRVKPNIVAQGSSAVFQIYTESLSFGSGTSFSSPLIAGIAACLWQAFPDLPNYEIINSIEENASQFSSPDTLLGYGIPDFFASYKKLNNLYNPQTENHILLTYPNPFINEIKFYYQSGQNINIIAQIASLKGNILKEYQFTTNKNEIIKININGLNILNKGVYLLIVLDNNSISHQLIVK